jgi:hypothetical protein
MAVRGWRRSFLCARIADATERAGQTINLGCLLADLGLHVLRTRPRVSFLRRHQKCLRGAFQQLRSRSPLHDLVGVEVKLLGQFGQGLSPFDAATATFTLNAAV